MARESRGRDGRFISAFRDYVDLLVEGSVREIKGQGGISEKLEGAGRSLIEAGKDLGISGTVERLVGEVSDLAKNGMLAPEPGAKCTAPEGGSVYTLKDVIGGLERFFEGEGLTLYAGLDDVAGRCVVDICLGESSDIKVGGGVDGVVFTKLVVQRTGDRVLSELGLGESGVTSDWECGGKSYFLLESKIEEGRKVWSRLNKGTAREKSDIERVEELAWSPLFEEATSREEFAGKYAIMLIRHNYLHEQYHARIAPSLYGPEGEAAAELYAMARGNTPFEGLKQLTLWKHDEWELYSGAAKIAFHNLRTAAPEKSLGEKAAWALGMIEKGLGLRNHEQVETEIGFDLKQYGESFKTLENAI